MASPDNPIPVSLVRAFSTSQSHLKYKKTAVEDDDLERNVQFLQTALQTSPKDNSECCNLLAAAVWLAVRRRKRLSSPTNRGSIPKGTQFIDLSQPNNYILRLRPGTESPTSSYRSIQMNHRLYSLAKKYIEGSQPANRQRPDKSSPVSNYTMGSVQIVKEIPQRSQECPVCETVYPSNELYCVSKCTHSFCSGCLFGYIKTMIDSNKILDIGCLDSSCDSPGLGDKICAFLNSHNEFLLEIRYRRIRNAGMALKWNKKVCPNEACYAILQDVNEEYRSCNTCKINLCWKCNNLFHDDSPCAVTEAVDFLNCMDKNKIIKCPRCSVNITKAEGCNHMKCAACTNEFCWICRKNYTPDHYSKFNPFGCPGLQFDEPTESSSARCCYKTRAYLFWLFIVLFFPLVYVVFLLSVPTYYYLKRQRNIVKENLKKKANLHKFKEDRGYGTQDQVVVEEYKLRKEHSTGMKVFMCCLWGLAGIPFMLLGLLITVLALPFMPCYFVYKCKSKK